MDREAWQATYSPWGCKESATTEQVAPSLGWGDPLEKRMTTHSSILAWRIP